MPPIKPWPEVVGNNVYAITKVREDTIIFANAAVEEGYASVPEERFEPSSHAGNASLLV